MAIRLTKDEFLKRYLERATEVKPPSPEELKEPIMHTSRQGNTITNELHLGEYINRYFKNLVEVVYREP